MGCSKFYSFFCKRTPAMVFSKENEKIMNSLEKFGLTSTRDSIKAFLISAKVLLASTVHLIPLSFLTMLVMFFTTSTKFVINLLKKFTLPRNDCISFLFMGKSIFCMAATLVGSNLIPYLEITWLRSFPSSMVKLDFFGFNEMPNFLHFRKTCLRCSRWSWSFF